MYNKPLTIAFNWKMNPTSKGETEKLFKGLKKVIRRKSDNTIIIFPPFLYLDFLSQMQKRHRVNFSIGAQDVFSQDQGAYTSFVSAKMLHNMNIPYAIIGHSETRIFQKIQLEDINQKLIQCFNYNISPVLCIGYQSDTNHGEVDFEALKNDLVLSLTNLKRYISTQGLRIAYEPTWAIGTGKPVSLETLESVVIFIKKTVVEILGVKNTDNVSILYGGSIDATNIGQFLEQGIVDGFLIGGASLDIEKVKNIIEQVG